MTDEPRTEPSDGELLKPTLSQWCGAGYPHAEHAYHRGTGTEMRDALWRETDE